MRTVGDDSPGGLDDAAGLPAVHSSSCFEVTKEDAQGAALDLLMWGRWSFFAFSGPSRLGAEDVFSMPRPLDETPESVRPARGGLVARVLGWLSSSSSAAARRLPTSQPARSWSKPALRHAQAELGTKVEWVARRSVELTGSRALPSLESSAARSYRSSAPPAEVATRAARAAMRATTPARARRGRPACPCWCPCSTRT